MFLSHTYILALRFAFGFVLGAVFGSFGTMLAYRLPRGLSIVRPRSHCTSCGTT
ncbi:MAG: prepilin peptidase, partial [Alphaproteobacteria bacterium]|nr:prepilin peptidase [Alphaproteobacteria bacterium]